MDQSKRPARSPRLFPFNLRFALAILGTTLCLTQSHSFAQRGAEKTLENYDRRLDNAARATKGFVESGSSFAAMQAGLGRMRTDLGELNVVMAPELDTPEVVGRPAGAGFLTKAGRDRASTLRQFLSDYADAYGLTEKQVANLELVADYENPAGNMAWAEFEQRINGLPVFRGLLRGGFTAKGELARTTGQLAPGLDAATLPTTPTLTAAAAVANAASNVGWQVEPAALSEKEQLTDGRITLARGTMTEDATAWLLYFPMSPGVARLAWATEIWGNPEAFLVLVDAEDGTILFRKRLTEYQSQPATYSFFNDDSPAPLSPTAVPPGAGTQAPFIGLTTKTLVGNEPPYTFNSLGWMNDGTSVTDGNNVQAGPDRTGVDGVDAPAVCPNRSCVFSYNPQTDEPLTAAYQNGESTDVFYWTNVYHDRLYLLGFNEAARNFQNANFGRGGKGADRISAEIQDSSSTNNANFTTPADGSRGKMQMYLFPGPTPDRTSGIDHDVLLHELTHGVSNRLHNNGSGLTTTMSRAMGEGWSDFYARALLSGPDEDPNGIYNTGGWITYQLLPGYTDNYYYGIRRFPYAVIGNLGANGKPHNPLTFADIDPGQINTTNGAYASNPLIPNTAFEVHNAGEVWANALNEVRARFITRLGFGVGNERVLQFVTDGMKLDPASPTFLQARDSILFAATIGGTPEDIADIWSGFAARGMGYGATVVDATAGTVTEAFDVPFITVGSRTISSESSPNGVLDPGETVTVTFCIGNKISTTGGSITATLLETGGVLAPAGAQSYGTIPGNGSVCRNFTFTVGITCGATLTPTLQVQEIGGSIRNLVYAPFTAGTLSSAPYFGQNFDAVTAPTLPPGWNSSFLGGVASSWVTNTTTPDTAPNKALASLAGNISDNALTSPTITIPMTGSMLKFRHSIGSGGGGVLEIAIGFGAFQDILDAGGSFVSGGYTGTVSGSANPVAGRKAWTTASGGYITTTVSMPAAAAGQNVVLRWRLGASTSTTGPFWSVDTISLTPYVCGGAVSLPQIVAPAPGSLLPAGPVTFQWIGAGYSQFFLSVGTMGVGSSNILEENQGLNFSRTISNVPMAGGTLYVRLWYYSGAWQFTDYTYTMPVVVKAAMVAPINSSAITVSPAVFTWTAGAGVSQYCLWLGTTSGGADLYNGCGGSTTAIVSIWPNAGATYTLFARLWSLTPTGWQFNSNTYSASIEVQPALMSLPFEGSTLGTSATFYWTAGLNATQYLLTVGTTNGGSDISYQDRGTNQSATVSGLPTDGVVYVRLWSLIGNWVFRDYVYNFTPAAYNPDLWAPKCALPVAGCSSDTLLTGKGAIASEPHQPNTILNSCTDGTSGAFHLFESIDTMRISTLDGGVFMPGKTVRVEADVWAQNPTDFLYFYRAPDATNPSWTLLASFGIPDNGPQTLSATYVLPLGNLQAVRGVFRSFGSAISCGPGAFDDNDDLVFATASLPATMVSPVNGSTLASSSQTFSWNTGAGVTQYILWVGTAGAGSNNIAALDRGTNLTANVTGLPVNGSTIYVRLWSLTDAWEFRDYTYATFGANPAAITNPAGGSTLTSSSQTFDWNAGGGATQYVIWAGTTGAGSNNIAAIDRGMNLNATITGLPTNGSTIYVRLWSLIAGNWLFRDYTYTAFTAANPAVITAPTDGSTLTSSSQTFSWNAGRGATQYVIWAGTTGAGSNNIAAIDRGANLNATITGLPVDGSTIHVRLWSLIGANWQFIDYTYTAVTASSPAAITSPTNGSTLASSSQTFSWDAGSGAAQYVIWVGTIGAGSQDIAALDRGTNQSATVTGLPTNGGTIYVRLWSLVVGGWQFRDYTYTAAGP